MLKEQLMNHKSMEPTEEPKDETSIAPFAAWKKATKKTKCNYKGFASLMAAFVLGLIVSTSFVSINDSMKPVDTLAKEPVVEYVNVCEAEVTAEPTATPEVKSTTKKATAKQVAVVEQTQEQPVVNKPTVEQPKATPAPTAKPEVKPEPTPVPPVTTPEPTPVPPVSTPEVPVETPCPECIVDSSNDSFGF